MSQTAASEPEPGPDLHGKLIPSETQSSEHLIFLLVEQLARFRLVRLNGSVHSVLGSFYFCPYPSSMGGAEPNRTFLEMSGLICEDQVPTRRSFWTWYYFSRVRVEVLAPARVLVLVRFCPGSCQVKVCGGSGFCSEGKTCSRATVLSLWRRNVMEPQITRSGRFGKANRAGREGVRPGTAAHSAPTEPGSGRMKTIITHYSLLENNFSG